MGLKNLFTKPVTVKKCLILLLLFFLIGVVAFAGYMAYILFLNPSAAFAPPDEPVVVAEPTPLPAVTVEPEAEPVGTPVPTPDPEAVLLSQADLEFLKDRVNILLIGADEDDMRDQSKRMDFRSDVLMLLALDLNAKTADLISVPRDSYAAQYNATGRWKINAALAHGGGIHKDGFLYCRETVSMLLGGIPIPYHIAVKMDGLKKVVDIIGGVDYDVDVQIKLNGRVLEKGVQRLDGQQVLDYCRARKGISTDVGRADRQQRMLFTIFNQMKSQGRLTQVPALFKAMQEYIYTNLNAEQIAALAVFGLQLDSENNLHRHTLEGEYMSGVYNFSFYALYQQKKCELVKRIFDVTIKPDNTYDAAYIKVDWACIQGEKAIEAAEKFLKDEYEWVSDYTIPSQINQLQEMIDLARGGNSEQDAEIIKSLTSQLLQSVQDLLDDAMHPGYTTSPDDLPQPGQGELPDDEPM